MRRAALCLLLPLLLAAAPALGQQGGQEGGQEGGRKDDEKGGRHVLVEVRVLEAQLEECEPLGADFDKLLGELEPGLRFPSALDEGDRRDLLGEVGEASKRKPAVDDCGAELQGKLDEIGGTIGGGQSGSAAADSATSGETLELVALRKRFEAAERRVDRVFGPRVRTERDSRFQKILALAEELID